MGNAAGTITVSSPLYNGAFLEDQAYLGMDSPYVLFLKKSGNTWEVVNGTAGAMNGEYLADVRIIADEYKNNNALFSEAHISTQESVFTFLATKDAKRRLLEVMKGQFSDADAPFLSTLLLSGEPYLQEYAAQQAGNNKIYAVIHALANVCEQSSDHQVRSGCILALGKLESVAHISLIQKSLLSSFEREQIFAIIALGLIGDSSAIDSLVSVYDKATEDYIKSHIITALSRMKNSDDARSALVRILEEETDKTLITTAKSKIAGL